MKLYLFLFFLLTQSLSIAQIDLPRKISVKLYSGGNYQNIKLDKGVFENTDSIEYTFLKEDDYYYSDRIFFKSKTFIKNSETFESKNINLDSTMIFITDSGFYKETVSELISWSDSTNYSEEIWRDTITGIPYEEKFYVPQNLSPSQFGIDLSRLKLECECYKYLSSKNIDCEQIELAEIFGFYKEKNWSTKWVSSYFEFIELRLFFEEKEIKISQHSPGDYNIKWTFSDGNNSNKMEVINPRLNSIIFTMIPNRVNMRNDLLEFKKLNFRQIIGID